MKNILQQICSTALIILITACNDENHYPLPPCHTDAITQNTKFYFNQTGTLTIIDADPDLSDVRLVNIINSHEVSEIPLVPCNLPVSDFNIEIGDTLMYYLVAA